MHYLMVYLYRFHAVPVVSGTPRLHMCMFQFSYLWGLGTASIPSLPPAWRSWPPARLLRPPSAGTSSASVTLKSQAEHKRIAERGGGEGRRRGGGGYKER